MRECVKEALKWVGVEHVFECEQFQHLPAVQRSIHWSQPVSSNHSILKHHVHKSYYYRGENVYVVPIQNTLHGPHPHLASVPIPGTQ